MQTHASTISELTRAQAQATTLAQITPAQASIISTLPRHAAIRELEHYAYIVNHSGDASTFLTIDAEGTAHVFTFNTHDSSTDYETLALPQRAR